MGLLDNILGAMTGGNDDAQNAASAGGGHPLVAALGGLLQQNGGLQGLIGQFSQKGLGDIVGSWVGMGENKPVSADQLQSVLGNEQIAGLASKLGIDPQQAAGMLSEHLPKIVDKLTPTGQVEEGADAQGGLAAMLPGLLQSGLGGLFGGGSKGA